MKRAVLLLAIALIYSASAHADFVILHDGRSYAGTFTGAPTGKLTFTGTDGVQYTFPLSKVQTLVFSNLNDHISLRDGQSYSGHLTGTKSIRFRGDNGVGYVFPLSDVSSLVFTKHAAASQGNAVAPVGSTPAAKASSLAASSAPLTPSVVLSSGTQIVVRTDTAIDTATDPIGKLYPAEVEQNVVDSTGAVGIPARTPVELKVVDLNQGTTAKGHDYALALASVTLHGKVYRVNASSVAVNGSAGFGMNKRTAAYSGGGAGLGALLGAVFGGGKGAGIGALAGGAAGALTQYLTRGKRVHVPAESTLTFALQKTMVLQP